MQMLAYIQIQPATVGSHLPQAQILICSGFHVVIVVEEIYGIVVALAASLFCFAAMAQRKRDATSPPTRARSAGLEKVVGSPKMDHSQSQ